MLSLALLVGRLAFLALLYLFIFMVVRSMGRDLRFTAARAMEAGTAPIAGVWEKGVSPQNGAVRRGDWVLVVERSAYAREGEAYEIPLHTVLVAGRAGDSDIRLPDTFVSARHVRFEARQDGLLVEDMGSTNGTMVNGDEIERPMLTGAGDVVAVGDTVFRVEAR